MAEFQEVMRQDARMRREVENMTFLHRMDDLLSFDCARFERAVMRWARLHPEKTMKDVLLEKFPKAQMGYLTENVCPGILIKGGPVNPEGCIRDVDGFQRCKACWNRPAPEE